MYSPDDDEAIVCYILFSPITLKINLLLFLNYSNVHNFRYY